MQYRYLGEKTVQMKRCVLSAVQAAMTEAMLAAVNAVRSEICCLKTSFCPSWTFFIRSRLAAEVQKMGPDQLLMRVRNPTAMTLKELMPLYALERSMEEMALEPPKAKKVACWRRMELVVICGMDRLLD